MVVVGAAVGLDVGIRHDPISVDFHTYLAASRVGLAAGWSQIYDQALVATQQRMLAPDLVAQPFLSPPTVALLTAPLTLLPYDAAYVVWAAVILVAFAAALAASSIGHGWPRWVAVAGALTPWWVMHAVNLGQVVPLVAAGTVLAWRLARDRRDVLGGIALVALLLKPNVALLVPLALLVAGRTRLFAAWAGAAVAVLLVLVLTVGIDGLSAYASQLEGPMPGGADNLTLQGALGATGVAAAVLRLLIVGAVLAGSIRLAASPGLVVALAIVGSLLVSPYLHASDLCLLAAAGWMVWQEQPGLVWRVLLTVTWILASPFVALAGTGPTLRQWPWIEIALLVALVFAAGPPLTRWGDAKSQAPA